jgi:hypothetical protein
MRWTERTPSASVGGRYDCSSTIGPGDQRVAYFISLAHALECQEMTGVRFERDDGRAEKAAAMTLRPGRRGTGARVGQGPELAGPIKTRRV